VKSLAFQTLEGPATIGVMAPGEYEFGTDTEEIMQVLTGQLVVKLPGATRWETFSPTQSFTVAPQQKFQLQVPVNTSYLCLYR
jgi:uncharacterized protein YaiE (UPF0345 family)